MNLKGVIVEVKISVIETYYFLCKSHLAVHICTIIYVEYSLERFVQKSCDYKYCNILNSKLCHGYIFASFTKFLELEQLSLKRSKIHFVNELIRTHVKLDNIFFKKLHAFTIQNCIYLTSSS